MFNVDALKTFSDFTDRSMLSCLLCSSFPCRRLLFPFDKFPRIPKWFHRILLFNASHCRYNFFFIRLASSYLFAFIIRSNNRHPKWLLGWMKKRKHCVEAQNLLKEWRHNGAKAFSPIKHYYPPLYSSIQLTLSAIKSCALPTQILKQKPNIYSNSKLNVNILWQFKLQNSNSWLAFLATNNSWCIEFTELQISLIFYTLRERTKNAIHFNSEKK